MRRRRIPKIGVKSQECDRCGWVYEKEQLKEQRGGLVCPACYDEPHSIKRRKINRI